MKTLVRFAPLLLACCPSFAQTPPWTVNLSQSLNPLPLGMCGAVHLTLLDPATHDVPRNPQGYRLSMADFDMSVSGGTSASGHYIDASHFDACGCQGGVPGSTATVTARYPAQALPAAARIPGVSFVQTATFTLALPKGPTNPPSCLALTANPPPAGNVSTAAGGAAPAGAAAPAGGAAAPAGSSTVATAGAPIAGAPSTGTAAPAASQGTPSVSGSAAPAAVAAGRVPAAAPVGTLVSPTVIANPTGVRAIEQSANTAIVWWPEVKGASHYVVFGPGTANGGVRVDHVPVGSAPGAISSEVQLYVYQVPSGPQEFAVASYFPNNVSTPASEFSRVTINMSGPPAATPAATPPASAPPTSTPTAVAPAPPSSGHYLVTLTGIRCYQASMDDLLSRDGMGDEVYASTYIRRYDRRTGQLVDTSTRRSAAHGDVQYFGNQRLQAGSRSQTGGIQDGDMIPGPALIATRSVVAQDATFPMRLWEGTLADGIDALIMSPSLWEQDVGDSYHAQWLQNQQMLNLSLFAKQGVQDQISQNAFGALIFGMSGNDANASGLSMGKLVVDTGMMALGAGVPILSLLTTSADRPIGIVQNGRDVTALPNHTVILTREIIEAALARPPLGAIPSPVANLPMTGALAGGIPAIARIGVIAPKPGIIVINLQERDISGTLAFPERPAIYQMYIQVERIP